MNTLKKLSRAVTNELVSSRSTTEEDQRFQSEYRGYYRHGETQVAQHLSQAQRDDSTSHVSSLQPCAPSRFKAVAVMGPTGSGKSNFINKLAPGSVKVGHELTSCTEEIQEVQCKVDGQDLVLIDTPGFNDTDQYERSDTVILQSLMSFMKQSYDEKVYLSGIIYLHPLTDARMTGSSVANLRMFRKLCGDDKLQNVVLTTTKWDITPSAEGEQRQKELEDPNGYWGFYLRNKSRVRKFINTPESAQAIVQEILCLGSFMPKIQQEAIEGRAVKDTDAGAYLNQALDVLREQHAREMKALRDELKQAHSEHDVIMEEMLERERCELEKKVSLTVEEQKRLHEAEIRKLKSRMAVLEKREQENNRTYPVCHQRFWHARWRCMGCEDEKTERAGRWTCPACGYKQDNQF